MVVYGYEEEMEFIRAAREMAERGMGPRIRLYHMSSDGLNILGELSVRILDYSGSVSKYARQEFGDGHYCAKLFSTKYGRNILEGTLDFILGEVE